MEHDTIEELCLDDQEFLASLGAGARSSIEAAVEEITSEALTRVALVIRTAVLSDAS